MGHRDADSGISGAAGSAGTGGMAVRDAASSPDASIDGAGPDAVVEGTPVADAAVPGDDGSPGDAGRLGDGGASTERPRIDNVRSAASYADADTLTIAYEVATDGLLVARMGWVQGPSSHSITFDGEPLQQQAAVSHEEYWMQVHAAVYTLPVSAGQSGVVTARYPGWARIALVVATITGATSVDSTFVSEGQPTNMNRSERVARHMITTGGPALLLSTFTSNGPGPSDLTGEGHLLDAFPTVPLVNPDGSGFHSSRFYGGHAAVGAGDHALGYENSEPGGWFDYILVLTAFSN